MLVCVRQQYHSLGMIVITDRTVAGIRVLLRAKLPNTSCLESSVFFSAISLCGSPLLTYDAQ